MNRLLIIDGHAYAYRAFYAIRELKGPSGQPTNAIYGFVKMLEKMRQALQPAHLIVVWDGGLSAERLIALPEYKAHRPEMPGLLQPQFDEIDDYLEAAGVTSYCADGIEADDYIGCLARHAEQAGWEVIIASADKDFMQLVSDRVGLLNPNDKTGALWGREQVVAKSGVEPGQIADWLALVGDAVDNIAGVAGIGPKTAADLLQRFGSVEKMLARLGEVKSDRMRSVLEQSVALLKRNVDLVRLREVACEFNPEKLAVRAADHEKLRVLFQRWGFNGMLGALKTPQPERQAELI